MPRVRAWEVQNTPSAADTTPSFAPTKHHTRSLLELVLDGEITLVKSLL